MKAAKWWTISHWSRKQAWWFSLTTRKIRSDLHNTVMQIRFGPSFPKKVLWCHEKKKQTSVSGMTGQWGTERTPTYRFYTALSRGNSSMQLATIMYKTILINYLYLYIYSFIYLLSILFWRFWQRISSQKQKWQLLLSAGATDHQKYSITSKNFNMPALMSTSMESVASHARLISAFL